MTGSREIWEVGRYFGARDRSQRRKKLWRGREQMSLKFRIQYGSGLVAALWEAALE